MGALRTLLVVSFIGSAWSTCADRKTPGLICESCDQVATCLYMNSVWTAVPVQRCDTNSFCDSTTGQCSKEASACNQIGYDSGIPCNAEGVFPNPYDCRGYYTCTKTNNVLRPVETTCPGDSAFNAAKRDCSLTSADATCSSLQYQCANVGDAKPYTSNPQYYYICKNDAVSRKPYPEMYTCPNGETFDSTRSACSAKPATLEQTCNAATLSADPNDCHSYFSCPRIGTKPLHYTCPPRAYFNAAMKQCVLGTCQ